MQAAIDRLGALLHGARPALEMAAALLLHLLLLATAVQAWLAGWPGRVWLVVGAACAVAVSALMIRRARGVPLVVGSTAVAVLLVAALSLHGPGGGGLRVAGLTLDLALGLLAVGALIWTTEALTRLAVHPRLPRWARYVPVALGVYAALPLMSGMLRGASFAAMLGGWGVLPSGASGGYLGAALLLPLGSVLAATAVARSAWRDRPALPRAAAVLLLLLAAFASSGVELTRAGMPNLAARLLPAGALGAGGESLAGGSGAAGSAAAGAPAGPPRPANAHAAAADRLPASLAPGDRWLAAFAADDLDGIFARVATGVRYEPYAGVLRGAGGTAIAGSGNSADQALLLAELLRRAGYRVRFARGTLGEENAAVLIRGMYPPRLGEHRLPESYAPYVPEQDGELLDTVRDHVWVEVFQGEEWLPLDPSFPRATVGAAYAAATVTFDELPAGLLHRVAVAWKEESVGGSTRELARFEGSTQDLGFTPVSLVVRAVPQVESTAGAAEPGPSGSAGLLGGMGSAMGGGGEATPAESPRRSKDPKVVGLAYRRELEIGGAGQAVEPTVVPNGAAGSAPKREWLEFTLTAPGGATRRIERVLYELDERNRPPAEVRRYTVGIFPGRVPHAFARAEAARAAGLADFEALEREGRRLARTSPDDPAAERVARDLFRIDEAVGVLAGHLLLTRFAAESDSISRIIADGSGVALAWSTPRILIANVETARGRGERFDARVSIDLRLDEVRPYPYPGASRRVTQLFNRARGLQESVLEGALVAQATGREHATSTARLVSRAERDGVPLLVIGADNRESLARLASLPGVCSQRMAAALERGREVIVPARAVRLEGTERWGWWEFDPRSGEIIGVMEDGQHQGMVEYSVSNSELGLNDYSGYAFGGIMGAMTTSWTLTALLLEHGSITPVLLAQLESFVGSLMCQTCLNSVEATASAGAGVALGDCLSKDWGASAGISATFDFCDNYYDGFKCTSAMMMSALKGEGINLDLSAEAGVGIGASFNCDEISAGAGVGS